MPPARALAPLLAAATLLSAWPCVADQPELHPVDLRLEYGFGEGTTPCLDQMGFRGYLIMNTEHYDPFDPEQAKHLRTAVEWRTVRVEIVHKGPRYGGTVKAFDAEDNEVWSKKIETARCEDVVDGLAFTLALGLDVSLIPPPPPEPAPTAPPAPSPVPVSVPAPPPTSTRSSAPARVRHEPWRPPFRLGAGAFLALGRVPAGPSPGLLVSGELGGPLFSVAMDMRFLLPVTPFELESGEQSAHLYFSAFSSSIAPCLHLGAFFTCLPLELGVRNFESTPNVSTDVLLPMLITMGPRFGVEWAFSKSISARLYGDASGSLLQSRVRTEGRDVWRESVVSGVVSLAFALRLDKMGKR